MIDNIEMRACRGEDIALLERLIPTGSNQYHLQRFRSQLKGDSIYLLALLDNQPVGHLDLIWKPTGQDAVAKHIDGYPELNAIVVIPELRSRGIGSKLIGFAEGLIVQKGIGDACLGVAINNPRAKKLYERLGYKDWGQGIVEESYMEMDEAGSAKRITEQIICMIKNLSGGQVVSK